jgi:hypothetical protein
VPWPLPVAPGAGAHRIRAAYLVVPAGPFALGVVWASPATLGAAVQIQYAGLVLECWYFFADARHPLNL